MNKKQQSHKLYVVRKYIRAVSAPDAILKEKTHPVDDVWVDDAWKENKGKMLSYAIGFEAYPPEESDD